MPDLAPALVWALLDLRGRRVHHFLGGCLATLFVSLMLPDRVAVILRGFTADPWQALWALPACFLPVALDSTLDYMEAAVARSAWSRRLMALGAATVIALLALGVSSVASERTPGAAVTGLLWLMSVALLVATLLGPAASTSAAFAVLLANWVFGLDELTQQPQAWALIMKPASGVLFATSLATFAVVASLWCRRGSRPLT